MKKTKLKIPVCVHGWPKDSLRQSCQHQLQSEREKFEKWVKSTGYEAIWSEAYDSYTKNTVALAWQAWIEAKGMKE